MGSKKSIAERFKKFIRENNISPDNLIELASYYVNNFQQISGYLQQADYFLYKEKLVSGKKVTESRAESLLSEYGDFSTDDISMI